MIYTVAIVGLVAMLFASIPRKSFRYGLEMAWLIIFVFLAIRYDFGNDYMGYWEDFKSINSWATFQVYDDSHSEAGWQILCHIFEPLGFFAMVAFLTAFECFVLYRFIKKYVPERYYWFSIFLFVFTPSMMLIGASMMRQMLAIILVVWSTEYIRKQKIIPFVILIFLASQFHSSAVILYPLYLLSFIQNIKANKWMYSIIIVAYVALSIASSRFAPFINEVAVIVGEEEALEYYTDRAVFHQGSGYGIILQMTLFVYLVFSLHKYGRSVKLLFLLLVMGTFIKPFASQVPLIERFTYYFNIFSLVCYPVIWGGDKEVSQLGYKPSAILSKKRVWDLCAMGIIVILTMYGYLQFFESPVWIEKFSTYHTIFTI